MAFIVQCALSSMPEEVEQCFDDAAHLQLNRHVVSQPSRPPPNPPHPVKSAVQMLIPPQLVMTGPVASIEEFSPDAMENFQNTRSYATGLTVRYLNDAACGDYLREHFGDGFAQIYEGEVQGSFRGDICRSAVLLREGGFYIDLDFQLHVPISSLIDEHTTFMTVYADPTSGPVILNALIAVRPNSPVMLETMSKLKQWYADLRKGLPGPVVMAEALSSMMLQQCPQNQISLVATKPGQLVCGSENLRFYQEENMGSGPDCLQAGQVVCPPQRAGSRFFGSHFGVFRVGKESRQSRLIGWPRYLACSQPGCGIRRQVTTEVSSQQEISTPQPVVTGPSVTESLPHGSVENQKNMLSPPEPASPLRPLSDDSWKQMREDLEKKEQEAWTAFRKTGGGHVENQQWEAWDAFRKSAMETISKDR